MDIAGTLHKTLIIRFSSVGDVVLSSLLLRVFHKQFPDCRIDYLVKSEYADLVRHAPHLSRVIEFPAGGGFRELWGLRKTVRREKYDLIVDIHNSLRSRLLCFGSSRVVRIRKRKLARFVLVKTKWNIYKWCGGAPGVADRYLETLRFLNVKNDGEGLEMFLPAVARQAAQAVLLKEGMPNDKPFIGLAPCARHANKMWHREKFAEVAATLARQHNMHVLLFGSGREEAVVCDEVKILIEGRSPGTRAINLADRLSLPETAAMMDFCSVIVTNDSGLMHLATARKRKVVAVFGPTVREFGFFPYGVESTVVEDRTVPCRPCTHIGLARCPRGHFHCMTNISSVRVIDAARELMAKVPTV